MQPLSAAANVAWQIAMLETVAAQHPLMESEHLLIDFCSLEKVSQHTIDIDLDE